MHLLVATFGACALLFAGCQGCAEDAAEPTSADPAAAEPAPEPGPTGVIEGVVRLAEGAELPQHPVNPMVAPPGRPALPEHCTPPQERDRHPVRKVEGNALSGMIVALSEFAAEVPHEPVTHELFIRDCRLTPGTIVATLGDRLRVVNETDYPFLPNFGEGMMSALLHEESREMGLARAGMRTLQCGFAASCGRAEIVTMYHPLHTVTDAEGHFRIEGVPAGEEVKINAWHLFFEEADETLTLQPGETRQVELVVRPGPEQPTAPEPTPDEPGPVERNHPERLF